MISRMIFLSNNNKIQRTRIKLVVFVFVARKFDDAGGMRSENCMFHETFSAFIFFYLTYGYALQPTMGNHVCFPYSRGCNAYYDYNYCLKLLFTQI